MKLRSIVPLALFAFLGGVTPLLAGTGYVPVAANLSIDGVTYQTGLWISNVSNAPAAFSTRFIADNTDGTPQSGQASDERTLIPGGTFFVQSVAPEDSLGMLEITADSGIVAEARLTGTPAGGVESVGTEVPLVASENVKQANETAVLQGIERDQATKRSSLGIVNLGAATASCSVALFRANSVQIQQTAVLQVPAIGRREFYDALGLLGEVAQAHVRVTVTCNQPFYTYATVADLATGEVLFIGPSVTPDLGSTVDPPPGNVVRFTEPGVFHAPRQGNAVRRLVFPVPAGSYTSARAQLDVRLGPWAANSNGSHNIFWMVRDGRNGEMFGYVNLRGPNTNQIWYRHGFNGDVVPRITAPLILIPGELYHFDYLNDAAARRIDLVVRTEAGIEIARLRGTPNVSEFVFGASGTLVMDFGFAPGVNPAEPPSFGWQYSNLVVDFTQ